MPRPPAPETVIVRALADAASPILALDASRKIVFVNRALEEWLGVEGGQLLGRQCQYRADHADELAAVCAALCPPPEAFSGTAAEGFVSRLAGPDRPFERRIARYIRLGPQESTGSLLLLLVKSDVAEPLENAATGSADTLHAALIQLRSDLGKRFHISQLLGESDAVKRIREQVKIAAESHARVLVIGPSGSGREHVARTIHYAQKAASIGALVPLDCSLIDAEQMQVSLTTLLRSQYELPADRPPAALLLDVDRLRADAQQELAGFFALPGVELHTLATARTRLDRLVKRGKFRADLAFTLSTLEIVVPPLAKRAMDIPLLAQHFLEAESGASNRGLSGFQAAALEQLVGLPWKGNLDELSRAVREACQHAKSPRVTVADLPPWVHLAQDAVVRRPPDEPPIQLDELLARIEKEVLARALRKARGNKSKAAELVGLTRQRLLRRLEQLGLVAPIESEEPVIFEPHPDES